MLVLVPEKRRWDFVIGLGVRWPRGGASTVGGVGGFVISVRPVMREMDAWFVRRGGAEREEDGGHVEI